MKPLTTDELYKLIQQARPLTEASLFEQRVSFIYGQLGGNVTKDQIRDVLESQGYWAPSARAKDTPA